MLVYQGRVWDVRCEGPSTAPAAVEPAASGAPVLDAGAVRWSMAYGSNANPARIVDKGLDLRGALVLPAVAADHVAVWEARRTNTTGAVPLTLLAQPGVTLRCWALGVHRDDTAALDATEGRGHRYLLGRVGPVAVADRFVLADAPAFGPGTATRVLAAGGAPVTAEDRDQAGAAALLDDVAAVSLRAEPLARTVPAGWPDTPLADLDLFTYGTLQPWRDRWDAIADLVEVVGEAAVAGRLVATYYGWPAASFGGSGSVHGTVLRPRGADAARRLFTLCDDTEDVPHLFRRVTVPLRGTRTRWAAAYEWNDAQGAPPGDVVPSGRWVG